MTYNCGSDDKNDFRRMRALILRFKNLQICTRCSVVQYSVPSTTLHVEWSIYSCMSPTRYDILLVRLCITPGAVDCCLRQDWTYAWLFILYLNACQCRRHISYNWRIILQKLEHRRAKGSPD